MMKMSPFAHLLLAAFCCGTSGVQAQGDVESAVIQDDATLDAALSSEAANEVPSPQPESELAVPSPSVENPSAYSESAPVAGSDATPAEESPETAQVQEQESQEQQEQSDEPAKAEAVAESPAAVTPPSTEAVEMRSENISIDDERRRRIYGRRLFGSKKVQLAMNRPTFTDHQNIREKLYGKPRDYVSVTGDWFPADWWVNPGLSFRMGGYSASGRAAKGTPTQAQVDQGDIEIDENSKTTLLFIPLLAAAKVEMTPFSSKWIVLEAWAGYEYGWWQETRDTTSAAATVNLAETKSQPVRTSKGTKSAVAFGGSVNFLLNWLDERTVRSMVDTMGISSVYLTPFFESVRSLDNKGLTFSRNSLGVGFTFESFK